MKRVKNILQCHAPAHLRDMKSEHVMVGSAYGVAAASFHHWIGSVVVALAYFTAAFLGAREHAKQEQNS